MIQNCIPFLTNKRLSLKYLSKDKHHYFFLFPGKYFKDDSNYPFMFSLFEIFLQKMEYILQTISTTDMLHVEMEVNESI